VGTCTESVSGEEDRNPRRSAHISSFVSGGACIPDRSDCDLKGEDCNSPKTSNLLGGITLFAGETCTVTCEETFMDAGTRTLR
jgi:hypothetical protein